MVYRLGHFELNEERRELRRCGERISVEPLIFDLLALLVRNRRRVVSKEELQETLWPEGFVTESSLHRAVSIARSTLDDHSRSLIQTFTGYGYRFAGQVSEEGAPEREPVAQPARAEVEPTIRYARTRDGVNVAFWTLGEGLPLVCMTNLIWSHTQLEWRFPEMRRWFELLAERRQVIRFDPRGTGLSQRAVDEYTIEALALDLEAVVDRLRLERFALLAAVNAGMVAVPYAAHNPERVSHLVLWCTWSGLADYRNSRWQALAALQPLMGSDWETYTETRAHAELGWSEPELARRYAGFLRECTTPDAAWRAYREIDATDVGPLLSEVPCPTLVANRRQFSLWSDQEVSKAIAARVPDSRLVHFEGAAAAPYLGDIDHEVSAVHSFLEEDRYDTTPRPRGAPTGWLSSSSPISWTRRRSRNV